MGKVKTFEVYFDAPRGVYHAGSHLKGKVLLEATQPVQAQKISVLIVGKGKVHWTKSSGGSKNRHTTHYRSEEYYFNNIIHLLVPESGHSKVEISQGVHEYRFEVAIPQTCPSSYEGAYGYVRYWCKAVYERPWKWNIDSKSAFTVIAHQDLNLQPQLAAPYGWDFEHEAVRCGCCGSGNIRLLLQMNKRGFVPGEPLLINGQIHNGSQLKVDSIQLKLDQSVDFYGLSSSIFSSGNPHPKKSTQTVRTRNVDGVLAGETKILDNVQFIIPSLPPSGLKGAKYINIDYLFKIKVVIGGWQDDVKLVTPITIGTIPILQQHQAVTRQPVTMQTLSQPTAPPMPQSVSLPPPTAPMQPPPYMEDLPPPSYEECVSGQVAIHDDDDNQYTRGNMNYAPVYPYYNWNTHPVPGTNHPLPGTQPTAAGGGNQV